MPPRFRAEHGYSLIELLVSIAILMIVSGTALNGLFRLTKVSQTVSNRTEMHSGVRNATELLQQEIGQAGRISLPQIVQLDANVASSATAVPVLVKVVDADGNTLANTNGTDGMFVGEKLLVGAGDFQETVTLTDVNTTNKTISAVFVNAHATSSPVTVFGGLRWGVVPQKNFDGTAFTNGSTNVLMKIAGDINGDGTLRYVEYKCDPDAGYLYRRSMPYNTAPADRPAFTADKVLLNNIKQNPDLSDCFKYEQQYVNKVPYVVDVAITLTVKTPDKDPVTGLEQTETKALLNVAPRNVFNVWQLDSQQITNRVQDLPPTVQELIKP